MNESERRDFGQLVKDVMAYYRQDTSAFLLTVWWNACKPFELEQIQQAMQRHMTDAEHGQFAPKVADMARMLMGTATDRALVAWGKVHDAMSAVGAYQDVVFDDPAIHAVIEDLGGWVKVCRTDLKEVGYLQHKFCESHRAYTRLPSFDYPRKLGGAADGAAGCFDRAGVVFVVFDVRFSQCVCSRAVKHFGKFASAAVVAPVHFKPKFLH